MEAEVTTEAARLLPVVCLEVAVQLTSEGRLIAFRTVFWWLGEEEDAIIRALLAEGMEVILAAPPVRRVRTVAPESAEIQATRLSEARSAIPLNAHLEPVMAVPVKVGLDVVLRA